MIQDESCRVSFGQLVNAWVHFAFSASATIERGCSIGANHAQNCPLTSSTLETRAIARFRIFRARFNKRPALNFPKATRHSDICDDRLIHLRPLLSRSNAQARRSAVAKQAQSSRARRRMGKKSVRPIISSSAARAEQRSATTQHRRQDCMRHLGL